MTAASAAIAPSAIWVGAYRESLHRRPRCNQTLGSPIALAPPMSASGLSPTIHAPDRRILARSAAMPKMRGFGLLTPASSEITQSARYRSSPVCRIFSSCWRVAPLLITTGTQPASPAIRNAQATSGSSRVLCSTPSRSESTTSIAEARNRYRSRSASATSHRSVSPSASTSRIQSTSLGGAPIAATKSSAQPRNALARSSSVLSRSRSKSGTPVPYVTIRRFDQSPACYNWSIPLPATKPTGTSQISSALGQHPVGLPDPAQLRWIEVRRYHVFAEVGRPAQRAPFRLIDGRTSDEAPGVLPPPLVGEARVHGVAQRPGGPGHVPPVTTSPRARASAQSP